MISSLTQPLPLADETLETKGLGKPVKGAQDRKTQRLDVCLSILLLIMSTVE